MTKRRKTKDRCIDCGKTDVILVASELGPLCIDCTTLRIHHPDNVAYTEADQELDELLENGGKLS